MSKPTPASPADTPQPADRVQVKITRDGGHHHAGEKHPKGAVIRVSPHDAAIIVEQLKAGERVKGE